MEIDHLVICITAPEKLVRILSDFGLTEGEPNSHFGQGTSNHRFYFDNIYFEFLYLDDIQAAQSATTKPTRIYERFTDKTGNIPPFGICFFRDKIAPKDSGFNINIFPNWQYKPKFLPSPFKIDIFEAPASEPMYFFLDFISSSTHEKHKKFRHKIGFKNITNIKYLTPNHRLDSTIKSYISEQNLLEYVANDAFAFQLEFDGGTQGKTHDFRPDFPLIFNW